MSFPVYKEYKNSELDWLREIPSHWEPIRLKLLVREVADRVGDEPCELLGLSKSLGVVPRSELEQGASESNDYSKYKISPAGHLVMNKMQAWNGVFGISPTFGMVSPDYAVFEFLRVGASKFLCSLFRTDQMAGVFFTRCRGMGTAFLRLNTNDFLNIKVPLPPPNEQKAIAAFLDAETAKIDKLVAEQRRLIELLQEKRQAVISHSVTKGLNSNAPMKPSGIPWLGDVPEHWQTLPIRFAACLESGHTPSRSKPSYWEDCTVPWFTLADVWQIRNGKKRYVTETKEKVSDLGLANSAARLLPKGTVMLSRTASVGYSAIMGVDMATTQDFANWVCGPTLRPEFLLLVFQSMANEFKRIRMGSTHNTIYMPAIRAMRFALPSLEEQDSIIKYVDIKTNRFDELLAEAERGIELLQERRTALISAAVTGKIDVRGFA